MAETTSIRETSVSVIGENTKIEGRFVVQDVVRMHGCVRGEVEGLAGSTFILCESGLVEGNVRGDTLIIDGFIQGNIVATGKVVITSFGRVIGDISCKALQVDFGAYFEGKATASPAPTPA